MKKRVKIALAAYAAFNVLLAAVAGWLFAQANEKAKWGPPLRLDVPQHINVGYLRMDPKFSGDGYWYLVCRPDFVVQASASPLIPGERIIEYGVPSAIVSRPGLYKLVMLNDLGSFDFEVK